MENKHSFGNGISTLAGEGFVCTEEVILNSSCCVKVDRTGNMPTFILVLEPAVNDGKTRYLGRVHAIDKVFELRIILAWWCSN